MGCVVPIFYLSCLLVPVNPFSNINTISVSIGLFFRVNIILYSYLKTQPIYVPWCKDCLIQDCD